jgi:hypothetical protein
MRRSWSPGHLLQGAAGSVITASANRCSPPVTRGPDPGGGQRLLAVSPVGAGMGAAQQPGDQLVITFAGTDTVCLPV